MIQYHHVYAAYRRKVVRHEIDPEWPTPCVSRSAIPPPAKLAHEMSIPELVLRDAVEGKMGLTRGQWVKFGRLLGLPTTYILRPGERDAMPPTSSANYGMM